MKKFLLITFLAISQFFIAQEKGTLEGLLTDNETNKEPLPFANVIIKGTTIGTTTDFDGNYSLKVPTGNHIVVFSFLGYKTIEKPLSIKAGETVTINQLISAEEGVGLDEIIIKSSKSKESVSALLLAQKKAVVIKESIGAQELAEKGVSDAAGAVSKISGVSKQEGSNNVYVRGLGDRYLNTTMNGLSLPSNNVNKKNIDLSLFPSDVIQSVSISKAYSSNFYGDFAAGNVDIISKEYKGDGFFEVNIGSGVNSRAVDQNFVRSEGPSYFGFYNRYNHNPFAVVLSHGVDPINAKAPIDINIAVNAGKSFNFEDNSRLSLFGTVSFNNSYQFREGQSADFTTDLNKLFPLTREYEYATQTTAMLNAYYKINENHNLKFTSMFLNSSKDQVGFFGVGGLGRNREARDESNFDGGSFFQQNIQFNQDLIFVNQIIGNHTFAGDKLEDQLKLTYGVGLNNVFAHEPDRKRISLENYAYALDNDPTTNPTFFTNTAFDNQRYFQKIKDIELNSRVNLAYKKSENLTLNFGYNGRIKERDFENQRYGYEFLNTNQEVNDVANFNSTFNLENTRFFENQSAGKLYDISSIRVLPLNNQNFTSLPAELENTYSGNLQVHAGYVSAEIRSGEKLTIVPGIRVEAFQQSVSYDVINLGGNGIGEEVAKETFVLPSLNIKYALTEDQNLRFTFSKTVSVPEFKEIAPFTYEGVNQRIVGNPDILGNPSFSEVFNLDLKYEWFLTRGELISVAAFGKQINDPINRVVFNDVTQRQSFFRTGNKATVLGVELEVRKNLILNDDEKPQLSAGVNLTYMNTDQDLKADQGRFFSTTFDRTSERLQGASDILVNANINYSPTHFKNYKPIASIVFSYFSDRIDALGSGQLGNIVEKSIATLDFIWRNKIGDNWEVNFSAKNILDPSIERVREGTPLGDIILSQYKIGIDTSIGLKYKF
jgi:TonB-dependent receptor